MPLFCGAWAPQSPAPVKPPHSVLPWDPGEIVCFIGEQGRSPLEAAQWREVLSELGPITVRSVGPGVWWEAHLPESSLLLSQSAHSGWCSPCPRLPGLKLPRIGQHFTLCVCVCESLSFVTPWTVVHHSSLSMEFSRQEYWSGLPIPYPEDLPDPGIKPESSALQVVSLPSEPSGKPTPHDSHPQLPICFFSYLGVVYKNLSWSDTSLSKGSFLFWCQAGLCLLIPMRAEGKPVSFPYWEGTHSLRFYTFSLVTPAGFPELAGSLSLVMPVPLQDIPSLALRDTFPPDSALLDRVLQIYPWNKITGRKKERDWCHWDQYLHIYHRGGKEGLWEKSMVKILDSGFKSWPC